MDEINNIWKKTLEEIKPELTPSGFNSWLKNTKIDSYEDHILKIYATRLPKVCFLLLEILASCPFRIVRISFSALYISI